MNDSRQIKLLLKEAEMYLQFLNEDMDSVEFINEDLASRIEQLLQEMNKRVRELANLLELQIKGERAKKFKEKRQYSTL